MLSSNTSTVTYYGNDETTEFDTTFRVWKNLDGDALITVTLEDADGNVGETTNYTVADLEDNAVRVTYPASGDPLTDGSKLTITRNMDFLQETALINNVAFLAEVLANALDKLTAQDQQLLEILGRVITVPPGSSLEAGLPTPEGGKYLAWNELGTGFTNKELGDVAGATVPIPLGIIHGGTGASTDEDAREMLGLGDVSTEDVVPVAKGGTGADNATDALGNLGIVLGDGEGEVPTMDDLGTSATKDTGTDEGDVVEVQAGGKLPALDGSELTGLVSAPAGAVFFSASSSVPTGYLYCNGATISRATYADLFTAIGTTYGSGDGSTTFEIPDLRDEFIRGAGTTGEVGDHQDDATAVNGLDVELLHSGSGTGEHGVPYDVGTSPTPTYSGTYSRLTSTDTETRPVNTQLLPIIKY